MIMMVNKASMTQYINLDQIVMINQVDDCLYIFDQSGQDLIELLPSDDVAFMITDDVSDHKFKIIISEWFKDFSGDHD